MANSAEPPDGNLSTAGRFMRLFRPSHQHTAFSATLLLMTTVMLSRVIGYVRELYVAWTFGAGVQTDAFYAGFTIPDFLMYLVAGGATSITFISIYTRFLTSDKQAEAHKAFSVVITVMTVILSAGVILTEIFTPQLTHWWFHDFNPEQLRLCVHITRIILPMQIFFYVGGVLSAVLYSRRLFLLPSLGPILYNCFIIAGGVLLSRRIGASSLAYGALAGAFFGQFVLYAIGAARVGARYQISFDVRNPAFREWVRLSVPLMLGLSLVTVDDWFIRRFASAGVGEIARLSFAKKLFNVPIAILGQAVSQASLPFFARLFNEKRMKDLGESVNASIYRITAVSLLATSFMMAAALPLIDLAYRHGSFHFSDSKETATYFFWFSLSLIFWSAQGLYARAFYAAGNTLTPMIASTLITVASYPMYAALYRSYSGVGLVIASDLGIAANCVAMAVLLNWRKLIPTAQLPWKELGKAAMIAVVACILSFQIARTVPINGSRIADIKAMGLITVTWAGAVAAGLWVTKSKLLQELRRRKITTYPPAVE
jgi:putative peptidoglycan lipid II flippase